MEVDSNHTTCNIFFNPFDLLCPFLFGFSKAIRFFAECVHMEHISTILYIANLEIHLIAGHLGTSHGHINQLGSPEQGCLQINAILDY